MASRDLSPSASGPLPAANQTHERSADATEAEVAWAFVHELTKALTGLTCGGSEFFIRRHGRYIADIDACVTYVRARDARNHSLIVRYAHEAKEAKAELRAIAAGHEASGLAAGSGTTDPVRAPGRPSNTPSNAETGAETNG